MPDLTTLLASAARQEQPDFQPEFAGLADRWRRRRRRRAALAGGALVLLVGAAAAAVPLMTTGGLGGPDRSDVPAASASAAPSAASSAASSAVEVSGTLRLVGGPAGTAPSGVAGQVHFRAENGATTSATAGGDGRFSLRVPPGTYVVSGTSPSFGDGASPCAAAGPVQVSAVGRHDVEVVCSRR
jgi:hypothetical protein